VSEGKEDIIRYLIDDCKVDPNITSLSTEKSRKSIYGNLDGTRYPTYQHRFKNAFGPIFPSKSPARHRWDVTADLPQRPLHTVNLSYICYINLY
jgi:hypothetical protein